MNSRPLQILLVGLCLTGLAAGCATSPSSSNTSPPLPVVSSPPASTSSSATLDSSTIPAATTSLTNTGNSILPGWSTYTDPNRLYSIQYPNSLGNLNVPATKSGDLAASEEVELTWNSTDFYVYIGLDAGAELQLEKAHDHLIPQQTITVHGLSGTLYTFPGWQGVDERAFLTCLVNDSSTIYEIDLNGGLPGDEPLPSFWEEMLETFQAPAR